MPCPELAKTAAAAVLGLLAPVRVGAQEEAAQSIGEPARVQAFFAAGELGQALSEADRLSDPVLAAEWRCYLHLAGGDLPGALAAAEQGLALSPGHRGLLVNAASCALSLGIAEVAEGRARQLDQAVADAGDGASAQERERAGRFLIEARRLRERQLAGTRSLSRARRVAAFGLGSVLLALLLLSARK